jgi:hypothetical protein
MIEYKLEHLEFSFRYFGRFEDQVAGSKLVRRSLLTSLANGKSTAYGLDSCHATCFTSSHNISDSQSMTREY